LSAEAHIPFAFRLPDAKLPPGDYEIRQASDIDPELLEIRSKGARHATFFMAESSAARHGVARPSLVFELADAHRVAAASARHRKQAAAVKK
jgi:hypothetical protein